MSEIGYGGWGIGGSGWIGADEDESTAALNAAIERGVNFIDTARRYGESERIVGRVVRDHPGDEIVVATKVPPMNSKFPADPDIDPSEVFPGRQIRESVEKSLRALGLPTIDLLQLHVWHDAWIGRGDWLETVAALREEGKFRFFGVSVNDYQPESVLELVRAGVVDTVQVIYNVFEQRADEQLFLLCEQHDVGVIVRVPLDEGGLTGQITARSTFPEGDFRNMYFGGSRAAEIERRVAAIAGDVAVAPTELPDIALRFALDPPQVSTVIVGMRSVRHVERNTATSDGVRLDPQRREMLKRHRWERDSVIPT